MENTRSTYIKVGFVVVALVMTYILAAYVVPKAFVTFTKAAPASKVSIIDSRFLGQKILCKADGVDRCIVNVYILDKESKGVAGKKVEVSGAEGITALNTVTDQGGKASFAIVSKKEGQEKLSATVDGISLDKSITVTFRN